MKKILLLLSLCVLSNSTLAADLIQVYQQALACDPIFQQAIAQRLSDNEGVPINRAALLPALVLKGGPQYSRLVSSGSAVAPGTSISRGYNVLLDATQTVFDFSKFMGLSQANSVAKAANATLNAASQDLMIRVAKAYFQVLQDEDTLRYAQAAKRAFAKQLDQAKQQYQVGIKTVTDVYTAEASYESALANTIQTAAILDNDRENLRAITNTLYPHLSGLREDFPLVLPVPADIETWVKSAQQHNWSARAAHYTAEAAMKNIKLQAAGHLPTLQLEDQYAVNVSHNESNFVAPGFPGSTGNSRTNGNTVSLNLALPIFEGGLVVAQTDKAQDDYQVASQKFEQQNRIAVNAARQGYLTVNSTISQVQADKQAVKSSISSLEGMEAGYKVGTETLVNVLNQQQNVYNAEKQYATDRYAYINNLLLLKQAAGTLCVADLEAINGWLADQINHDEEIRANDSALNSEEPTQPQKMVSSIAPPPSPAKPKAMVKPAPQQQLAANKQYHSYLSEHAVSPFIQN